MTVAKDSRTSHITFNGTTAPGASLLSCEASLGGARLDYALIELDLVVLGDTLHDVNLKDGLYGTEVTVTMPTNTGPRTIHWGKIAEQRARLGTETSIVLVSRLEREHFGIPLRGRWTRKKPPTGQPIVTLIDRDLVFNPTIDGRTFYNASKHRQQGFRLFQDELATYTSRARDWSDEEEGVKSRWSLADVVLYLCGVCNPFQTHIRNPTKRELEAALDVPDDAIRDVHLPAGLFLPQALDRLLEPFNFVWHIQHDSPAVRRLKFVRKGQGATGTVGYQPQGQRLDITRTNVEALSLQFDTAKAINQLTVLGDYIEVEATFELVRAWPETSDELQIDDLALNGPGYTDNATYHRVWRDWVLNEAGDYNGTRPEIKKPYDLKELFEPEQWTIRRRQFGPTLTKDTDGGPIGTVRGVTVEWWDNDAQEWLALEDLNDASSRVVQIYERECGIRFNGLLPPAEIMAQGANAKVRVTATLKADKRLEHSEHQPESVNPSTAPLLVTVGDKFRKRSVHKTSIYFDRVESEDLDSDQVDDTELLEQYTQDLLKAFNQADCRGPIVLTGLEHNFKLGECIRAVHGRNIGLGLSKTETRFPQIAGITWNERDQTMTLMLETYYDDVQVDR